MKTFSVNDDHVAQVVNLLVENNIPFAIGDVTKVARLLEGASRKSAPLNLPPSSRPRKKERRANLEILTEAGVLKPGEVLELRDYQRRKVDGCEGTVAGKGLMHDGKLFSMSDLAQRLLTRHGYKKTAVRGPAHWFTKRGRSIKDLWDELRQELD